MTVGTAPAANARANAPALTPTLRASGRRATFWILAGTGALLVAILATLLAGGTDTAGPPLAADSPAPAGGMALAEVLREQGVSVTVADTLDEARRGIDAADDPTLFLFDDSGFLTASQLERVATLAERIVVASPDFRALEALAPGVGFGGASAAERLEDGCTVPAATAAETLSPGGKTLSVPANTSGANAPRTLGCFPSGENTFSVVEQTRADASVTTLVADSRVLSNEKIGTWGNAALALTLLGAGDSVVWYLPTLADVARTGPPSLGELTPGAVTPVLVLLVLVTLSAAIWRGRRFGPLVAENLPVTVKASETMEGRARLYARGSTRLRALDALRIGSVARLAGHLGLGRNESLDGVIAGVVRVTGLAAPEVADILVRTVPATDRELIALSDRLQALERATIAAVRPTDPQHERMDP